MGFMEDIVRGYSSLFGVSFNEFLFRLLIGLGLIFVGVFLGKIIAFGLGRVAKKTELGKKIRPSFINLIVVVIKWAVYIIFIDLALIQLPIPGLTNLITKILVVIPALVSALLLVVIGFAIAVYLREVVEDSEVTGWKMLSLYLYYFILYIFGVYALKIALISLDDFISNMIILLLTAIIGISVAFVSIGKKG